MTYRTDIQALRGYAILLVLLYHARLLPELKAGYLGVDVFFVVSGYLITGVIQRALLAGTFTFSSFYFRRAKRLLPAAYVTFGFVVLLSSLFLTRSEMWDFTWQLLGAITFTGNIALWLQTGYFEGAAHLKPLLHVWSLSIEEQYYLFLPAALVFTPRKFWKVGAFAVVVCSLLLSFTLVTSKPGAVFYLLPTRAWELALGSLGILALQGSDIGAWLARMFWPALAALLVLPFFPTGAPHPGFDALIICTATLIILLRSHPLLNLSLPARGMAYLGDISYSLYLVHWPLLAFAANAYVSPVPWVVRASLVLVALVLSWLLYHFVENPIKRADIKFNKRSIAATMGASFCLVFASFSVYFAEFSNNHVDYTYVRRGNMGFNVVCESNDRFKFKPECRNSEEPKIMVWGDSNAMHLVDGIVATTNLGVVQATKTTCGPLANISAFRAAGFYNHQWGEGCIEFNDSVLDYLSTATSVDVVVLSSSFEQYLAGQSVMFRKDMESTITEDIAGSEDIAAMHLQSTIVALRKMGKRVVLIAPPPMSGFNVGRCLELKAHGKLFFGSDHTSCAISEVAYFKHRAGVLALLDRVALQADVEVINLDNSLCYAGQCTIELNGTFLYVDSGHLTHDGSVLLGQRIGLGGKLWEAAR